MKKSTFLLLIILLSFHFAQAQCTVKITSSKSNKLCSSDSVLLTASAGFKLYVWSTGDTTRSIIAKQNIYYKVIAKNINNCVAIDSYLVQKVVKPSFTIIGQPQCDTTPFIFTNTTPSSFATVAKFIWNYGDGTKYTSGAPNTITQDFNRWSKTYTHFYTKNDVFKPSLITRDSSTGCIDTFDYASTGETLPENIIYQVEILTKKSATNNGVSDSICIENTGGGKVTLYNKYPLISKSGYPLNIQWHFHDANANPPGSDVNPFTNWAEPTYEYLGLGQYFPTLKINCPGVSAKTYTYYSKIDTIASNSSYDPAAINLTQLNTINGKILKATDTLFLKRNIYKNNLLIDSLSSKWTLFDKKQADTLKRFTINKLYGYGINIIGPRARIENPFPAGGPPPPSDRVLQWQKLQCGPTYPVQFINNSLAYQANKLWLRWDFAEDNFAPACTSYSIPNPSQAGGGLGPYTDPGDLQNRTIGAFIVNGQAYLGRLNSCNYSHDTMPTRQYTNWDVAFDWYRYGHDFPPYDSLKWAVGYSVWPTSQNPPTGKNWVQPRDSSTWKKPMTAIGPTPTRIDTMNIWPADLTPNQAIIINKTIPDPIAHEKGFWNYAIPPGHSITPTGFITPNDLGLLPNGQSRNYKGSDTIPNSSPPTTFYRYVFNRIIIKDYTVVLNMKNMKDSASNFTGTSTKCNTQSSVVLSFNRPDAYGLGKNGVEGAGFKYGSSGGDPQIIFDNTGFLDKEKTKPAPGILPSNERTFLLINYDSLLDRNDNTPCNLDNFVDWTGASPDNFYAGGLVMPMMYKSVNYPPQPPRQWSSPSGSKAYVHYFPNGSTGGGVANMPFDKKGNITIGLIVGTGCFTPTNCNLPACISDTVWYHNFFRFVELNPNFNIAKYSYENNVKNDYCYLRSKGETVIFHYEDSIQDNVLTDIWEWGDGTATIDSFYYTNNKDVPSSRKRFEFNSNVFPWQLISSNIINAGTPVVNSEIVKTYRCDDFNKVFPPIKIDTIVSANYPGLVLKPMSHKYTKSSYEQMQPNGVGGLERRGDITPVMHNMITNNSLSENRQVKYLVIGVIDTFTFAKYNEDTVFCVGETIVFNDSIRYWYPSNNCKRPLNVPANENDLYNHDQGNMHNWAYTKDNYPLDSIQSNITFDLSNYLTFSGTTATCPFTHNQRVAGTNDVGDPVVRCYRNRNYYHERIYWDFESDGTIDAFGPNRAINPITHKYPTAGTYKVSMISIDSIGAWDTCFSYLVIKASTSVNLLSDSTLVCDGFTGFTYIPGNYSNFVWSFNNVDLPNYKGQNTIFLSQEGLYKVTAKSQNGCGFTDQTVVYRMPSQTIIGPKVVNLNSPATYSAKALNLHAYKWTIKGGTITSGQGSASINVQWGNADSSAWIKLIDSLDYCEAKDSISIIINGPIGVNNINTKGGFIVFPNPTSDKIYISPQYKMNGNYQISIYAVDGKELKSIAVKDINTNLSLDVMDLNSGLYFIKIQGEQVQYTYRFVKQ